MIYSNSTEGSGNPTGKLQAEYDITYKCRNCNNILTTDNYYCSKCGKYIDWLDVFETKYRDE